MSMQKIEQKIVENEPRGYSVNGEMVTPLHVCLIYFISGGNNQWLVNWE